MDLPSPFGAKRLSTCFVVSGKKVTLDMSEDPPFNI
jgi:hypothetical protein